MREGKLLQFQRYLEPADPGKKWRKCFVNRYLRSCKHKKYEEKKEPGRKKQKNTLKFPHYFGFYRFAGEDEIFFNFSFISVIRIKSKKILIFCVTSRVLH